MIEFRVVEKELPNRFIKIGLGENDKRYFVNNGISAVIYYDVTEIQKEIRAPHDFPGEGQVRKGYLYIPVPMIEQEVAIFDWDGSFVQAGKDLFPDLDKYKEIKKAVGSYESEKNQKEAEIFFSELREEIESSGYDVISYPEWNKTVGVKVQLPTDLKIYHEYLTTRLNLTVIIGFDKNPLRVPNNLKGLIIGKGGKNIRQFPGLRII
jgi:hypothetical protein